MKQRRIKKLVKGHLNAKGVDGQDVYTDKDAKEERLLQLMGKSVDNPGLNLTDAQLLDVLLDADADLTLHKDDFAPFDAREQKDTDGDNIGDNKEIHDAAALISDKTADLTDLFAIIQDHTGNITLNAIIAAENEIAGAGLTDNTYNTARDAMNALNEHIELFDAGVAEVTALWNSIKDLVPTANVSYDAKNVTVSYDEAEGDFLNITNGVGAAAPLDIAAEKVLRDDLQARFDPPAMVDPNPNT